MISNSYFVEGIVVNPRVTQSCIPRIRLGSSAWQNPINRYDVVADTLDETGILGESIVGPADYQVLQDWLDTNGEQDLPPVKPQDEPYVDVDGDGRATYNDLIVLANYINEGIRIDSTDEDCYTVNTFSVERDLIQPSVGLLTRDVGLRIGASPLTDYRVYKRNFHTQDMTEVSYTTGVEVKDSIVFVHRDLFLLPECTPVTVPGRVENPQFDILLLFDDTGSFSGVGPLLIDSFADAVESLQELLPDIDLAFGVARFEDYALWPDSVPSIYTRYDKPFILNQPIISTTHPQFDDAITAALQRGAPGNGGDTPESAIEALFQAATGNGFDGNGNGTTSDNGPAGLISTQTNLDISGDVPTFMSFVEDPVGPVVVSSGTIGGVGFRSGAVHLILLATDAGFAYEPDGVAVYYGNEVAVNASEITTDGRGSTPGGRGATIQATIDALLQMDGGNGCQVIGLGTSSLVGSTPRVQLEGLAKLTGALNTGSTQLDSGIESDPILPGEPLYFRIEIDSAESIANAIVSAVNSAKIIIPGYFIPCPLVPGCVEESNIIGRLRNYFATTPEILPQRFVW